MVFGVETLGSYVLSIYIVGLNLLLIALGSFQYHWEFKALKCHIYDAGQ